MIFPLVANTKIKNAVIGALSQHKLPHAIIIEGEQGLGKHTLAFFLARAALCSGTDIPCDSCKNCLLAKSQNHPDISVTLPEDNKKSISVAQIRELRAETFIKPHTANGRVFIIDKAHTLNPQSQNALLKILEEPPANTYFILIAESKAALLETVLSRSTVFTLSAPEAEVAKEYISSVTDFDSEQILNALNLCKNNIGNALLMLAGKKASKTVDAAKAFLNCFLMGDGWGMITATLPFEKNRVDADALIKDLKSQITVMLRENISSPSAKPLSALYNEICQIESTLATNINLNLFFSALSCKAELIYKKWRSL